MFPARN